MLSTFQRFRSHIPSQYLGPLLLLGTSCLGCIFLLLFLGARVQDKMQQEREAQALSTEIATTAAMVRHDLQDYAKWDDAVRHISLRLEPEWINDNVSTYLGKTQGYSDIFILDGKDRTVYSFRHQTPAANAAHVRLGSSFERSLTTLRHMPGSKPLILSGFTQSDGQIFVYSAAAVVPLTNKVVLPTGANNIIVLARPVDEQFLAELRKELNLQNLQLTLTPPPANRLSVAFNSPDGSPLAWLQWSSHRPGSLLREQLAPAIATLLLIAILAAGVIMRRGARTLKDLRQSELRARHLSDHDLLTGLPNRRVLLTRIGEALLSNEKFALMFMDLDGFKDANDVYGHGAGDLLLKEAASRIQTAVGNAFVARLGGDEFAVLLKSDEAEDTPSLCNAILQQFSKPFAISAYKIKLGISIGFAEEQREATSRQDELMRRADVALYAAKAAGRNCARPYEPMLDESLHLRIKLESNLRAAVEKEEIFVRYQPIVEARTGSIIAVEALARWSDKEHGDVPPDVFIPIAEMSGLINHLGRQVLTEACKAMRDTDLSLTVNLSPAQFWDRSLVEEVQAVLKETGFPPERLELEITESLMLRRPQVAAEIINTLRGMGIRIALDDFGTGFASIGYLQQLKLDRLKVDKSFIKSLEHDPKAREMLTSIIGLARACDLEVCAEGIETAMQAQLATVAGCDRLQGWLFGRPQPASEFIATSKEPIVPLVG